MDFLPTCWELLTTQHNTVHTMNRPKDSQQPVPAVSKEARKQPSFGPKNIYLILYNFISALLWSVVLGRVLAISSTKGWQYVFAGTADFTKWTQTLAGLEVLHAAVGTSQP